MLVGALGEFSARRAHDHVLGVSAVFGKEIAWKQVNIVTTLGADLGFDPQEILDGGCRRTTEKALRSI
jgi:hypothetical protein